MLSDLEIARQAALRPIQDIAASLGVNDDELELYGKYKAKIDLASLTRLADRPLGKLIVVTAITPTPLGEGKTVTTIGLGQALAHIGKGDLTAARAQLEAMERETAWLKEKFGKAKDIPQAGRQRQQLRATPLEQGPLVEVGPAAEDPERVRRARGRMRLWWDLQQFEHPALQGVTHGAAPASGGWPAVPAQSRRAP